MGERQRLEPAQPTDALWDAAQRLALDEEGSQVDAAEHRLGNPAKLICDNNNNNNNNRRNGSC